MLAISCMPDHVHFFVGFRPVLSISDFVKEIKVESGEFVRAKSWLKRKFNWQEGYGVFSYSHSEIDKVIRYINNQEEHHKKVKFKEEYKMFLKKFDVSFDDTYLFEFFD